MALLWFYCDESYKSQSKISKTYVVSGFVAEEKTWKSVERGWHRINKSRAIDRFHASELNAKDHEFEGWTSQRSKRYSKALVDVLLKQKKKLHAVSVGLLAEEYERIISKEGREKFGDPYMVCFKSCITHIARKMEREGLPKDWKFSVIFDRNKFEEEAGRIFYLLKDLPDYKYRHRLGTCTPGSWEDFIALQPADLIAYETYRYLHEKKFGSQKVRKALGKMFGKNAFSGYYYDADLLADIKEEVEGMDCGPNGFIPMIFRE
jgi:hypothetical protein